MKIAYLSNSTVPSKKANSVHVMKMCNAFHNQDVQILLFALEPYSKTVQDIFMHYGTDRFKVDLVKSRRIPGFWVLFALYSISKVILFRPKYVYGRNILACWFSTVLGYRTIVEVHQPPKHTNSGRDHLFFKRLSRSKNLHKIVVISNNLGIHLSEVYGLAPELIEVLHDGADAIERVVGEDAVKDRFQVGYFGSVYQGRGIELLINLASRISLADFHIIGGTSQDIQRLVGTSDFEDLSNLYIHGFISPKDVPLKMDKMDCLVAPYQREVRTSVGSDTSKWMSPLKIFEYMSSGKPIIASSLPAIEEILEHEETALLCDASSVEEWELCLVSLMQDKKKRSYLGANARDLFLKEYTWNQRVKKILSFT